MALTRSIIVSKTRYGLALLMASLLGCGGSGMPETAKVRGKVEYDGKVLSEYDNAAVLLTPTGGRMASGVIQGDGTFVLSTFGEEDGAIVGPAHVTVSATVKDPTVQMEKHGAGVRWTIPEKFGTEDSGLNCEVVAGKENVFLIQLSSKGTGSIVAE